MPSSNHNPVLVICLIAAINHFHPFDYKPGNMPKNIPNKELQKQYDFIVVGSGSAGKC